MNLLLEDQRVKALRRLDLLDRCVEERFDSIVHIVQNMFAVPMVSITLIDTCRQWRVAHWGPLQRETSLAGAICAQAMWHTAPLVVPNLTIDQRFQDNPYVRGAPFLRFYASQSLREPGGLPLGALCLMDVVPRRLTVNEVRDLADLGAWVQHELTKVAT
jgi:GAF domain-containing protein